MIETKHVKNILFSKTVQRAFNNKNLPYYKKEKIYRWDITNMEIPNKKCGKFSMIYVRCGRGKRIIAISIQIF